MRFSFLSISLPLWRTSALGDKFSFFSPKLSAAHNRFIPEGLLHLCHIKKLKSLEYSRVNCSNANICFEMTFSLPFPSSLLNLPFKLPILHVGRGRWRDSEHPTPPPSYGEIPISHSIYKKVFFFGISLTFPRNSVPHCSFPRTKAFVPQRSESKTAFGTLIRLQK